MRIITEWLTGKERPARRDSLVLFIIFVIPFFQSLGRFPLIEPDEGRYAEIPREMLERCDFITPLLNYVKYFEKPPLHYWLNAIFMSIFGRNEFAARFAGALMGLLAVLLTYHIGRKLFGRRSGLLAALILGTCTGFLAQARLNITDVTLTCTLSASLAFFIVAAREDERHKGGYYYASYLCAALAVLAKGLIGIVFPGAIIFLFLLFRKRWRLLGEVRLVSGTLLFLLIAAPWFILVSLHNPEFPRFFFIHEHFERFMTKVHRRYQPLWYFVPVLLGTMLPWSFFIPEALRRAWQERKSSQGDTLAYLAIWALLIFAFFSKSNSKLVPYILPIFPPLALLMAWRWQKAVDEGFGSLKGYALSLCAVLLVLAIGARFAERHTGDLAVYRGERKFIHIDIEPTVIGKVFPADLGIVADAKLAVEALKRVAKEMTTKRSPSEWSKKAADYKRRFRRKMDFDQVPIKPQRAFKEINEFFDSDTIFVTAIFALPLWEWAARRSCDLGLGGRGARDGEAHVARADGGVEDHLGVFGKGCAAGGTGRGQGRHGVPEERAVVPGRHGCAGDLGAAGACGFDAVLQGRAPGTSSEPDDGSSSAPAAGFSCGIAGGSPAGPAEASGGADEEVAGAEDDRHREQEAEPRRGLALQPEEHAGGHGAAGARAARHQRQRLPAADQERVPGPDLREVPRVPGEPLDLREGARPPGVGAVQLVELFPEGRVPGLWRADEVDLGIDALGMAALLPDIPGIKLGEDHLSVA